MKRLVVLLLFGIAMQSWAVPEKISYQGYLTNLDGTPLDTVVTLTFGLYQYSNGGTAVWTQVQSACTVRAGLFATQLGPMDVTDPTFEPDTCWLGIAVGNNSEMVPRIRILSVPFAWMVGSLDGADGGHVHGHASFDNLRVDSLGCQLGIGFPDGSWQAAAWDTTSLNSRINAKADSTDNATRAWVNSMGYLRGSNNLASVTGFVGGGDNNKARGNYSVVAGGGTGSVADSNSATGSYSTIGGGTRNSATQTWSTVGGGQHNQNSGYNSVIAGGVGNIITGSQGTVGGGLSNVVSGGYATIAGGSYNRARGNYSTVCGGGGSIAIDSNSASGVCSFIGGGQINVASGDNSTVSGGRTNTATGDYSTVGGGSANHATDDDATVSGGYANLASGYMSTVGGGGRNHARGWYSTVAGGGGGGGDPDTNCASGDYSMIPGGRQNWADGQYSLAAGRRAQAVHDGSFVWADTTDANFSSWSFNTFNVRASGGYRLYSSSTLLSGVYMSAGASGWTNVSDSTMKRNRRNVDTKMILEKVSALPIQQWSYKSQDPSVEHIGPMAQDFWREFHVGDDSLGINQVDPDGIALAAIQELAKRNETLEMRNEKLEEEIALLRTQVQGLMAHQQQTINVK